MENLLVKVHQGHLRGIIEKNVNQMSFIAFRGVPFAKPPIGPLRFKDPEPMTPWSGIRNATKFGNSCAQRDSATGIFGSDDCLYLNIYTTTLQPTLPKAVMVWIHGGSFISGSGDDFLYGPDYLIEKDIVLVTINYRVGVLGFLNIEDEEAPGNQGLKDQVMALKWIQQNISQFGGDPNNVTIFGHSAGAASVHYLTISPLAQGLFHKAILQNGVASCPWAQLPKPPTEPVRKLASLLGRDPICLKEFVNYLRTLNVHDLVRSAHEIQTHEEEILYIYPFVPTLDRKAQNSFLTEAVGEATKVGINVPCICGYTSHDGLGICTVVKTNETLDKINRDVENLLIHPSAIQFLKQNDITVEDVKRFYFGDKEISFRTAEQFIDMCSTSLFFAHIENIIKIQSNTLEVPMYVYKFEYELKDSIMKKLIGTNMKGTCHGDELGFIFHAKLGEAEGQPPPPNSTEHRLIQRFTEMWTNFAKTGNPTPQISESIPIMWEPIEKSVSMKEHKYLKISDELCINKEKYMIQRLIDSKNNIVN